MSSVAVYNLSFTPILASCGGLSAMFVRDGAIDDDDRMGHLRLDAQVRSGDYFVMLATELDTVAEYTENIGIRGALEDVVSDLLYLQQNYVIDRKDQK